MTRSILLTIGLALSLVVWAPTGCSDDSSSSTSCGDGVCSQDESTDTCPEDCTCGNGTCDQGEDLASCAEDCSVCGDGQCTGPETCNTCEQDCGPCAVCGDGQCNGAETCENCEQDCGPCSVCGNGVIEANEDCDGSDLGGNDCVTQGYDAGTLACDDHCLFDLSGCYNYECGNGACEPGEDGTSCPDDCAESCGDGVCDPTQGETCGNCAADCTCADLTCADFLVEISKCSDATCVNEEYTQVCSEAQDEAAAVVACMHGNCQNECAAPGSDACQTCLSLNCGSQLVACSNTTCPGTCGDGVCDQGEQGNCPEDCPVCGDNVCSPGEDAQNCPGDCPASCGDGTCSPGEGCDTCPTDCGTCPASCGDGECDPAFGESCTSCPSDCTCGDQTCMQILNCLNGCNNDLGCVDACFESGCAEAQNEAQALYQCALDQCGAQCGADFSSQACQLCVAQFCSQEAQDCYNGDCAY